MLFQSDLDSSLILRVGFMSPLLEFAGSCELFVTTAAEVILSDFKSKVRKDERASTSLTRILVLQPLAASFVSSLARDHLAAGKPKNCLM